MKTSPLNSLFTSLCVHGTIRVRSPKTIDGRKNREGRWGVYARQGAWSYHSTREEAVREGEALLAEAASPDGIAACSGWPRPTMTVEG